MAFSAGDPGHVTEHNRAYATQRTSGYLLVRSAADLPAASGGEHLLPSGGVVEFAGAIDLGANAIRIPATNPPTVRGMGQDSIMSSAPGGVVRCTDPAGPVVLREFSIIATGGPCLNLSEATASHQLNAFFLGLFGVSAGTISGFDVQAVKDCFINCADGLTFTGTTNKVFVSQSPFYGVTGSAITFDAGLTTGVIDITHPWFKFDAPGTAITAEVGYTVGRGVLTGTLFEGTLTKLAGLSPSDPKWDMRGNPGLRDSAAIGAFVQDSAGQQITTVAAVDTPVKALVTTTPAAFNERFDHAVDGTLTCRALDPGTYIAIATGNISSPDPNQTVRMWITKNGTPLTTARGRAELAGGGDIDAVTANGVLELAAGDTVDIYVENLTSAANITLVDASLSVTRA